MFDGRREEEAQEELGIPEIKSSFCKKTWSPKHSKLPAKGRHSITTKHTTSHHWPFSSEHISPSVLNITTIFKSSNSEGNEDSINWVMRQKSSFLNRWSLLIGRIIPTLLWSCQVTVLTRITILMISHWRKENRSEPHVKLGETVRPGAYLRTVWAGNANRSFLKIHSLAERPFALKTEGWWLVWLEKCYSYPCI